MIPNDGGAGTGRREFLFSVAPAGVLACLGCERVGRLLCASASPIASPQEKFGADSQLTFEEVYKFAFASNLIPLLKSLREELPGPDYLDRLKRAGERMATGMGAAEAKGVPTNDFAAFKSMMNATDRFWDHVLTRSIVEDTDSAMQVRITECLWAKTFR
ncbi:MAG: hypothetical protein FIA95_02855, partial [Gemmatimonadetes bacterium]|nr:hypothetical protein [Gemmatimonadota bacterium]